ADRLSAAIAATNLLGAHRLKYGVDLVRESAGSSDQVVAGAFAQNTWRMFDALWLDEGLRYDARPGAGLSALQSRFGMSWDFTGRGLSRAYVSYGRFYDPLPLAVEGTATSAMSAGVQYQVFAELVASGDYTHRAL